ncbi:hypothetical protein HDV57DRAFT_372158 [Trichoderma longibrachiatum]|uniref:Uncharacterized protein n=1 Tax=Trichoderma longibrachiatum ATCC 18648 TaxID=983965 RepID=A0A2T4BQ95_TRILO|nr:hypothetical protein M440DRAFT_1145632 [Trichoderma longibrachiatum ATCC 18648]
MCTSRLEVSDVRHPHSLPLPPSLLPPSHPKLNKPTRPRLSTFQLHGWLFSSSQYFAANLSMDDISFNPRDEAPDTLDLTQHVQRVVHWLAVNATAIGYASWHSLRWHLILSLAFQHVRICATMTPKEAHDRILDRLQQEYYPLRQSPAWCRLAIRALIVFRYIWLAAKMLFLELYLLDLAFWKLHRFARQRNIVPQITRTFSPGFHRLAVLAPLPPSRFRYVMAETVASIWYLWVRFFSIPLLAWMILISFKP